MLYGIFVPLLGTVAGAAFVFLMRGDIKPSVQKFLSGFASGVMIAASIWSLIMPAIDMAESQGMPAWLPVTAGFILGGAFLLVIDALTDRASLLLSRRSGLRERLGGNAMLVLAVTLHNLPEGMAVGVAFAGAMCGSAVSMAGAYALATGIALQNIPEGSVISLPMLTSGKSRMKAFLWGVMSGVVEPIGAVITVLLAALVKPVLPYILAFAAGAMIYVVCDELIPQAASGGYKAGTVGAILGFAVMMLMDVALG